MACTAVGSFPKELPVDCVVELVSRARAGAPKGELLQLIAQCAGQIGAIWSPPMVGGSGTKLAKQQEIDAIINELDMATQTKSVSATDSALASSHSIMHELLLNMLVRLLQSLVS